VSTRLVARTGSDSTEQPHPNPYNLQVYRGDSAAWRFILWTDEAHSQAVDLSNATAMAQMRDTPDSQNVIGLLCTITLPNIVDVSLDSGDSNNAVSGQWDLQLSYPGGTIATVVAGSVLVTPDVTRPSP
jgi:hypothetical protein